MAHALLSLRREQTIALEPRDDHRDVVRSAVLVRTIDQLPARHQQIVVALREHLCDLVLPHESRQSVRAQHQRVATPHLLVGEIDLHRGLGAKRLQNDVASLASLCLLRRQLPRLDEPLHQ